MSRTTGSPARPGPEQALLYRLFGDRNPLHSDPAFAAKAGFERPILHGLCTYGVTGRALLHTFAESDPSRFVSMSGRFSRPVHPGESLTVSIWRDGDTAQFRTTKADGTVVIDRGRAAVRGRAVLAPDGPSLRGDAVGRRPRRRRGHGVAPGAVRRTPVRCRP